jgi:hypothetical protein
VVARILFLLAALAATAFPAAAAKRIALVIGNGSYKDAPLKNPVNDARAMAEALKSQGFEVLLKQNGTKIEMERVVADFGEKLGDGDTALFYYAGHGMQVNGRNFLIPTDAQITSEQRVRLEAIDVDVVLEQMASSRSQVNLVILDACRNNPFERKFRSVGGGLAQINAPEGTLISYATAPGKVANDGDGANGLYTEELLKAISQPGLKVEEVFKAVRVNVSRRTNGAQTPWEASSLTGDFYFRPPALQTHTAAPAVTPAPAPAAIPNSEAADLAFWDSVKGTTDQAELRAYIDKFPNGTFVALARARMAALARTGAPPPSLAATPDASAGSSPNATKASPAPQQLASLPTQTGDWSGKYEGDVRAGQGVSRMQIEVTGRDFWGLSLHSGRGSCRLYNGTFDANGRSPRMVLQCDGGGFPTLVQLGPETGMVTIVVNGTPFLLKRIP